MYFTWNKRCGAGLPFLWTILLLALSVTVTKAQSSNPNDIHFRLYPFPNAIANYQEIIYQNQSSLTSSQFLQGSKTVLLIHGFAVNGSSTDMQVIKNAYLNSDFGYNYIIVDYGALSSGANTTTTNSISLGLGLDSYSQVVTINLPIIVQRVGDFINWLVKSNYLTFDKVHIVGHSLGGQIAGGVGNYINTTIGTPIDRITGLDPAGPGFLVTSSHLQQSDAVFVDIIHTDAGELGTTIGNAGHVDFFPNGGIPSQPGCAVTDLIGRLPGICSHEFAFRIYAASFTKNLMATGCPDLNCIVGTGNAVQLEACVRNSCPNLQKVPFGVNALFTTRGQYYLKTDGISSCPSSSDLCTFS